MHLAGLNHFPRPESSHGRVLFSPSITAIAVVTLIAALYLSVALLPTNIRPSLIVAIRLAFFFVRTPLGKRMVGVYGFSGAVALEAKVEVVTALAAVAHSA